MCCWRGRVWADTIGGGAPSEHGHCLIRDVLVHLQVVYEKYLDLTDEPSEQWLSIIRAIACRSIAAKLQAMGSKHLFGPDGESHGRIHAWGCNSFGWNSKMASSAMPTLDLDSHTPRCRLFEVPNAVSHRISFTWKHNSLEGREESQKPVGILQGLRRTVGAKLTLNQAAQVHPEESETAPTRRVYTLYRKKKKKEDRRKSRGKASVRNPPPPPVFKTSKQSLALCGSGSICSQGGSNICTIYPVRTHATRLSLGSSPAAGRSVEVAALLFHPLSDRHGVAVIRLHACYIQCARRRANPAISS
ncbi:hypothetical protein V2G26_006569 [Clonostachys chloroleuca]